MDLDRDGHTSAPPQRALRTLDAMDVRPVLQRHPALRWLVPLAVVGVGAVVATGMFRAQATSERLPETSPRALLAAVQQPVQTGFSGTVVSRLSLGLPELPSLNGTDDATGTGPSFLSLLTGSHTLKVWYGGLDQQRIALLGATDETDVFRTGRQVWEWNSADRTAVHTTLPDRSGGMPSPSAVTPAGLADDVLRDLDPSTRVTVSNDHQVANRAAYELVLTPRTSASTIGSVRIAVDGKTKTPLGVRVFARGKTAPAVDVAYTSIAFTRPSAAAFSFVPPPGATVRRYDLSTDEDDRLTPGRLRKSTSPDPSTRIAQRVTTTGAGWATVWTYRGGSELKRIEGGALARASQRVYGPWGAGRLFTSDLVNALVVDDGRVLAGAVEPDTLFAAAR